MKTNLTSLVKILAVTIVLCSNPVLAGSKNDDHSGWLKKTFSKMNWEEIPSAVSSPKDICKKVRSSIEFRTEQGDQWASGSETWTRGWGDCEDFAACVTDLCHARGLDAKILVFTCRGSRDAHAVAMGTYNGKLWLSSNGWYTTVDDMDEAKAAVADEMGWDARRVSTISLRSAL